MTAHSLDLKRLDLFCKVVEFKNFSKAAEAAHLSQPTVSENIRLLEEAVGEKLLDRLGREVLTTAAGELLYQHAKQMLQLRDQTWQAMHQFRGRLSGNLALGASSIPGSYVLPEALKTFHREHPEIRAQVMIGDSAEVIQALLGGSVEIGLIGMPAKDGRLESVPMFADELVLVVPPDHPWSERTVLALPDLLDEPVVMREDGSGTRRQILQLFQQAGLDPDQLKVPVEMGSNEAVRQAVRQGIGISIISRFAVQDDLHNGQLIEIPLSDVVLERQFYKITRRGRQLSPLAIAFNNSLLQTSQSTPA